MGLILFLIMGLIAGFIARALMPGDDSMGLIPTMVLGVIGSFVGGLLLGVLTGTGIEFSATGLIGSIIGAFIALFVWRMINKRRVTA